MRENDFLNKLAFQYNESVKEHLNQLCRPLFECSGIETFRYVRLFNDGKTFFILSNSTVCTEYILSPVEYGPIFQIKLKQAPMGKFYYFLWPCKPGDYYLEKYFELNIWNGLSIYKKEKNYVDCWSFAGNKRNNCIQNFYLNRKNLIEEFLNYFNTYFFDIIENPKVLASFKYKIDMTSLPDPFATQELETLFKILRLEKQEFKTKQGLIHLSKREKECLAFLPTGKTSKEIAKVLNLAPKTIEFYLYNIKQKTGYKTKTELASFFLENVQGLVIV